MPRSPAALPAGPHSSDYLSVGVLNKVIPFPRVEAILQATGRGSQRQWELAESRGSSLSKLLKDAILVYERDIAAGYEPGTRVAEWTAEQGEQGSGT